VERAAAPPVSVPASPEERKVVTVVFADLLDSTALAERLDPELMREVLRTYFEAMREAIEAEGGTVEKFIGDAVVAVFGVPNSHEDDPARALRASSGMLRQLETVNANLRSRHEVTLDMRIGVNSGSVLASTDPEPGEALVTGDVVNVAARLQMAANRGEVLVAERTVRAVRGFVFVDRGTFALKGKHEMVRAYALTAGAGSTARGLPGLRAPMVGRDAELAMLTSVVERVVRERRPHLVTIFGEAGVGKSRLVHEFVDRLEAGGHGALVLSGRCLPYGDGVTYWPLAEILKGHAGVLDADLPEIALSRIGKLVAGLLGDEPAESSARIAADLAYTVGIADPALTMADLDPRIVRQRVHAAWRVLFSALAAAQPVISVVEDIHWADPALLDLLDELVQGTEGPVLFVCPSRPELVASRPGWGGGRRNSLSVSLYPLDDDDSERLVCLLLTVQDLPGSLRSRILERAEGNPFFLEEILRRLIDEQLVVRDGSHWRARPGLEQVEIPDTVQGVLAARIDLLDPFDKRVLQAAAVIGRVFWSEPVGVLLNSYGTRAGEPDDEAIEEALSRLGSRDLVQQRRGHALVGQREFSFTHILTRDVAYDSIPKRDRGFAHAVVAHWLEQSTGDRSGELAELLAYHYSTAINMARESLLPVDEALRAKAFGWLMRASAGALSKYVLPKAQRLAQNAVDLAVTDVERFTAMEALGAAYVADSRGDLAWQHLRDAALVADRAPDVDARVAAGLIARACEMPLRWPGSMHFIPELSQVRVLLDRGLELVPGGDSLERARLLSVKAGWPFTFPEALTDQDRLGYRSAGLEAAEMALRLGDADLASGALDQASAADMDRGHYRSALAMWQRRWDLRDRLTSDREIGDVYGMGAWIHCEVGEYEKSVAIAEQVARSQDMPGSAHARAWRITSLFRLGRWDEALLCFQELRERLDDRRDMPPNYCANAYGIAALIHQFRGERMDGDRLAAIVQELAPKSVRAVAWRANLLLAHGQFADATKFLAHPPTSWEIHAADVWEARCDAALALASATPTGVPGELGSAAEILAASRRHVAAAGTPSLLAFADRLEGLEAAAARDLDTGAELLTRALRAFTGLSVPWEEARTQQLLIPVLGLLGRSDEAAQMRTLADLTLGRLRVVDDLVLRAAVARLPSR
jgi:class 3 adenylate cyclase/tetratricopeptide (TPR) repeat protein